MTSILKHPVLQHPERYIKGKKYHSSELYQRGFYDSLDSNIIAQGFTCTKSNGLKYRFPVGNMVRLIVNKVNDESYLMPYFPTKESKIGLYPSSYILNDERFIDFIIKSKQYKRFIPQKFRFKNESSIINKVQLLPTFKEAISEHNLSRIKE